MKSFVMQNKTNNNNWGMVYLALVSIVVLELHNIKIIGFERSIIGEKIRTWNKLITLVVNMNIV